MTSFPVMNETNITTFTVHTSYHIFIGYHSKICPKKYWIQRKKKIDKFPCQSIEVSKWMNMFFMIECWVLLQKIYLNPSKKCKRWFSYFVMIYHFSIQWSFSIRWSCCHHSIVTVNDNFNANIYVLLFQSCVRIWTSCNFSYGSIEVIKTIIN